MRTKLRNNH